MEVTGEESNLVVFVSVGTRQEYKACKYANVITETCLYKFDPLQPHFYIVKLRFTGVYIIFFLFRRGGSNEYPQSMF